MTLSQLFAFFFRGSGGAEEETEYVPPFMTIARRKVGTQEISRGVGTLNVSRSLETLAIDRELGTLTVARKNVGTLEIKQ